MPSTPLALRLADLALRPAFGHVGRHLTNRARIRRLIAEHPGSEREPVEKPVFVVGLPRTATTLTHGVLPCRASTAAPLLWELLNRP
ncbi:hypothetical protein ACFUTR_02330 [Streptomyces sp. NPDC057367]|uniref:hypothetical protein n=1 Tax=Streptomyces sp. NPDC057367 TaxID=3346108 RepID=UPI003630286F